MKGLNGHGLREARVTARRVVGVVFVIWTVAGLALSASAQPASGQGVAFLTYQERWFQEPR